MMSSVTSSSITVQWGRVSCIDRNSEITGYTVRYGQTGSTTNDMSVSGTSDSDRMFTASGLIPRTSYTFEVAAVSSEGIGPFSTGTTVETLKGTLTAQITEQNYIYQTSSQFKFYCLTVSICVLVKFKDLVLGMTTGIASVRSIYIGSAVVHSNTINSEAKDAHTYCDNCHTCHSTNLNHFLLQTAACPPSCTHELCSARDSRRALCTM